MKLVASITGIEVRETLPDRILDEADEVELIDIATHALRQRMKHGNIYPPERIETALNHFFREGNLLALRELALRLTAQKTEAQLQQYMTEHAIHTTWATTERVLVGFDYRPQSQQVIRDAWRLAHGLDADLIAVHIEPEGYPALLHTMIAFLKYRKDTGKHQAEAQRRLEEHVRLAEDRSACTGVGQRDGEVSIAGYCFQRARTSFHGGSTPHACGFGLSMVCLFLVKPFANWSRTSIKETN